MERYRQPVYRAFRQKPTGLKPKRLGRGVSACHECRRKRTRCDPSEHGKSCLRCAANGQECIRDKSDSMSAQRSTASHAPLEVGQKGLADTHDLHSQEPQLAFKESEYLSSFRVCSPTVPAWSTHSDEIGIPGSPNGVRSSAQTSPSESGIDAAELATYCSYSFLSTLTLDASAQAIRFLNSQDCFRLPGRPTLDRLFRTYFIRVHPFLPLLNESDFWQSYKDPTVDQCKKTSLLVVRAMLFAACNFLPSECVLFLGHPNMRSARAAYYKQAKLIYDFGMERSPVAIAQAALLLSSWNPPAKGSLKPQTSWLTIAIDNAKAANAHAFSNVISSPEKEGDHDDLVRLWWCCIIRDRIMPLGLRRSMILTPTQFDFDSESNVQRGIEALQGEVYRSRMYDAETRNSLANTTKYYVKLCLILTDVLQRLYPASTCADSAGHSSVSSETCNAKLLSWYADTLPRVNLHPNGEMEHKSTVLFTSVMYIYFHGAMILLSHHGLQNAECMPDAYLNASVLHAKKQAQHSTASIADLLDNLQQLDMEKYIPISVVAYAAFPLAVHVLDVHCPGTIGCDLDDLDDVGQSKRRRLEALVRAMKIFNENYDGVGEVALIIRKTIQHLKLSAESRQDQPNQEHGAVSDSLYWRLCLSLALDWSLSTGNSPREDNFAEGLTKAISPLTDPPRTPASRNGPVFGTQQPPDSTSIPGTEDSTKAPDPYTPFLYEPNNAEISCVDIPAETGWNMHNGMPSKDVLTSNSPMWCPGNDQFGWHNIIDNYTETVGGSSILGVPCGWNNLVYGSSAYEGGTREGYTYEPNRV